MTATVNGNVRPPVVVGVDGSPAADDAIRGAAEDAALRAVPLRIVHALFTPIDYGPGIAFGTADFERMEADAVGVLEAAAHTAAGLAPKIDITTELVRAPRAPALITEAPFSAVVIPQILAHIENSLMPGRSQI